MIQRVDFVLQFKDNIIRNEIIEKIRIDIINILLLINTTKYYKNKKIDDNLLVTNWMNFFTFFPAFESRIYFSNRGLLNKKFSIYKMFYQSATT